MREDIPGPGSYAKVGGGKPIFKGKTTFGLAGRGGGEERGWGGGEMKDDKERGTREGQRSIFGEYEMGAGRHIKGVVRKIISFFKC